MPSCSGSVGRPRERRLDNGVAREAGRHRVEIRDFAGGLRRAIPFLQSAAPVLFRQNDPPPCGRRPLADNPPSLLECWSAANACASALTETEESSASGYGILGVWPRSFVSSSAT